MISKTLSILLLALTGAEAGLRGGEQDRFLMMMGGCPSESELTSLACTSNSDCASICDGKDDCCCVSWSKSYCGVPSECNRFLQCVAGDTTPPAVNPPPPTTTSNSACTVCTTAGSLPGFNMHKVKPDGTCSAGCQSAAAIGLMQAEGYACGPCPGASF